MRSISAGRTFAVASALSARRMPVTPRGPASCAPATAWPSSTAAERTLEENSSARIFIAEDTLVFFAAADPDDAKIIRHRKKRLRPVEPFHHRDSLVRMEVIFKVGREDLFRRFEPIKVQMKARYSTGAILIHEGEGWRMNPF